MDKDEFVSGVDSSKKKIIEKVKTLAESEWPDAESVAMRGMMEVPEYRIDYLIVFVYCPDQSGKSVRLSLDKIKPEFVELATLLHSYESSTDPLYRGLFMGFDFGCHLATSSGYLNFRFEDFDEWKVNAENAQRVREELRPSPGD